MSTESNSEANHIDDYLRNRLSEEETRQFEMRMLEDDALFAKVQREDLLRQGMTELPHEASESKPAPLVRSKAGQVARPMRWLQPALTGALALAVIALGIGNLDLRGQLDQMQAPRLGIPVITLHDQRALLPGTQAQSNGFGDINGPVLLEIDVSAYAEQEFQVEIQTARDTYTYARIQPDMRGYVTVYLPIESDFVTLYSNDGRVLKRFQSNQSEN